MVSSKVEEVDADEVGTVYDGDDALLESDVRADDERVAYALVLKTTDSHHLKQSNYASSPVSSCSKCHVYRRSEIEQTEAGLPL